MRKAWPDATVTLVGLPWARSFVARFALYLDGFLEFPGFEAMPERGFDASRMQAFAAGDVSFDVAIQLHGDGSVTNRFLPRLRPGLTAGFFPSGQKCPDPARFVAYPDRGPEIRRLLKLMHHLGFPPAGEELEFPLRHCDYHEASRLAAEAGLRPGEFVCLHPGARDPKRRWKLEKFLQVGRALATRGLRIVLTGTNEEAEQTAFLKEHLGASCLDLAGKTTLGGVGALLKSARLLVSNDTGVSHVAAALEVPSVVIFSASDPRRWAPLDTTRHRALGDPFASPAVEATAEAVLREAYGLLDDRPLRLEARNGGFPVLPPVDWGRVKRILLVCDGSEADLVLLAPCIAVLRSRWSGLALLSTRDGARVAGLFPGLDHLLVAERGSLVEPVSGQTVRSLVDQLRAGSFEATVIFNAPGRHPYTAAYLSYLAGIPIRVAASKEFGGALLTHWARKLPGSLNPVERHLALLRAVGLPSYPDTGRPELAVAPALKAQTKIELRQAGVDPDQGFVLLDDGIAPPRKLGDLVERLSNTTGMPVLLTRRFLSGSAVDLAAVVEQSGLVITPDALTSRLADAFGRPLLATGAAATPSDGWRPRHSLSKLEAESDVDQEQLLQAVRTLLWLPPVSSEPIAASTFLSNFTFVPGTMDN